MRATQLRGALGVLLLVAVMAGASPMISIHALDDWDQALLNGDIQPVQAGEFQEMVTLNPGLWPGEYESAYFATPALYTAEHADSLGDTTAGLVMYWGQSDIPERQVLDPGGAPVPEPQSGAFVAAAWDYVYPTDPDLTNLRLEFSIHVPGPGMFFSLNLIDEDGDFMEWVWQSDPDPGIPGFPWCQWTTVQVDPNTGWTSWDSALVPDATGAVGPFMGTGAGPGADGIFDLTRVARIRFDEMGSWLDVNLMWPPVYDPLQPLPPPLQGPWMWNAWDHVEVSPEPGTMLLLGGGLAVLLRRRRRR